MGFGQRATLLANATRTVGRTIISRTGSALRRFAVVVTAFVLGMGLMSIPEVPFVPEPPKADAQTGRTGDRSAATLMNDMGDCNFRQGDGPAAPWAKQLCWIDMSKADGSNFDWTRGIPVQRKIGRYTLTFTPKVVSGFADLLNVRQQGQNTAAFGNNNSGYRTFAPYGDDTSKPFLFATMGGTLSRTYIRFSLENISLKDEGGKDVPNFQIMMADAEMTTQAGVANEMISLDNRGGKVQQITRLTPSGFSGACNRIYGEADEPKNWSEAGAYHRGFVCYQDQVVNPPPGSFLVSAANPKNLDIALASAIWREQAIALAINIGRVSGAVSANTTYEKAATGQATKFDVTAATRGLAPGATENPVPLKDGEYTAATRLSASGDEGKTADDYVFRSKATGASGSKAFDRYNPVWTCTMGNANPVTIKEGSVPAGYTLNRKIDTGANTSTSELVVPERNNDPTTCTVTWEPRFKASSLQLSKTVAGSAAQFDEVQLRTFQLNYKCTDLNGFSKAYPEVKLEGNRVLQKGQSSTVPNLPLGTTCTINESFPDGAPPARPGKKLTLTWSTGTSSSDPLPTSTTKLDQESISVRANNRYDYRAGKVKFSKELSGEPVGDFGYPRKYDFELTCGGTTVENRHFSLNIDRQQNGNPSGAIELTDVPVARDCWIKPLTGLSTEESARIKFDGRDVTFDGNGIQADADGAYHFKLPDYAENTQPSVGDLHIKAKYSYQLRDVKVFKELTGNGAASKDLQGESFPVQYKCTWGGASNAQKREGTLNIVTLENGPRRRIKDIPVGAECLIWEQGTPEFPNVKLTGTKLISGDTSDQVTTLTNEEAKSKPIITVSTDTSDNQNEVHVRNNFEPKLGQVQLKKLNNRNGLTVDLPTEYTFGFSCGPRSVTRANGQVEYVPLDGIAIVQEGQVTSLRMSHSDPEIRSLLNDQDGNLGVPYGNQCIFSEQAPNLSVGGVLWGTDADQATFTVNQPSTTQTITNDYKPTGDGLVISQQSGSNPAFVRRVKYTITCTASDGKPLNMGEYGSVTLGDDPSTSTKEPTDVSIPPSVVPEGSTCEVTEDGQDPGTRRKRNGQPGDFPITRETTVRVLNESGADEPVTFDNQKPVKQTIKVGTKTSVSVTHQYDFVYTHVTGAKSVVFDPATQQYISDKRKEVKNKREFNVSISCLPPDNADTPTADSGVVSAATANRPLDFGEFPVGSDCTATEGATTTAAGISVKQEVSVNGGEKSEKSGTFDVVAGTNAVTFTNTYSRRLTEVKLNTEGHLPAAVAEQYARAGKKVPYYPHKFDLDCHDPETGEGAQGELLGEFPGFIQGAGTATYQGVPVGAECHFKGDGYGDFNLDLKEPDGTLLKATLRPRQNGWVVDKNDGSAYFDKNLADGVTESQYFPTVDGTNNNVVDLTSYYEYVTTKMKMSKKVVGRKEDLSLLNQNQKFEFTMQCKGVGYQYSELASDGKRIESEIALNNGFSDYSDAGNGEVVRTYTSPEVQVPVGAYCTFTETPPSGTPKELRHKVDQAKIAKYAGDKEDSPVESWDFVNRYERRTTPVRVSINQSGYLKGIAEGGYNARFTCKDPKGTAFQKSITTDETPVGVNVATAVPVAGGFTIDLPVGAECSMDLSGSPALAAREQLAVTAGARTPATQFNSWVRGKDPDGGPRTALVNRNPADITASQKNRKFTFNVPADLSSTENEMVIGAENHNFRGFADVTFTKTSAGNAGKNAQFNFEQSCSPGDPTFTLKSGESYTLKSVPIDSPCSVQEIDDGVKESNPILNVANHGARIDNVEVQQSPAPASEPGKPLEENLRRVNFDVLPVSTADDTSTSGEQWSLTAQNSFPGVQIEKKIDGSPISSITGAVADTAVLPDDATSMKVHYKITNTGAQSLSDIALKDPSLAGRKITNSAGQTITVPESGAIDANFCSVANLQLASDNTHECVFDVEITEPKDKFFSYKGEVTVTAKAGDDAGQVSDTDTYGAIRLQKAIGWMLPDTGAQTLLVVLLLGLLALAYGLYRYLRRRDEDEDEDYSEEDQFGPNADEPLDDDSSAHPLEEDTESPDDYDGQR